MIPAEHGEPLPHLSEGQIRRTKPRPRKPPISVLIRRKRLILKKRLVTRSEGRVYLDILRLLARPGSLMVKSLVS